MNELYAILSKRILHKQNTTSNNNPYTIMYLAVKKTVNFKTVASHS